MNTQSRFSTKPSPIQDRQDSWQAALEAARKHVKLGQELQEQGQNMINSISEMELTAEQAAKLIQQGTGVIEKGIKIEREALDKIILLREATPK